MLGRGAGKRTNLSVLMRRGARSGAKRGKRSQAAAGTSRDNKMHSTASQRIVGHLLHLPHINKP